jgi:CDGSH-type Zn-finger protein
MSDIPTIDCRTNGPYLIRNLATLRNSRGEALPTKSVIGLCRCGGSANKPFCDGTHQRNGFSSARLAAASPTPTDYVAHRITIHDDRSLCAHAGHCTDGLPAVFKYGREPWIDANAAAVDEIVATIRRCPSGALSYTLDGARGPDVATEPSITVTRNGPYVLAGAFDWLDGTLARGHPVGRWTLCRCGLSKTKPFCDGSHWDAGFVDDRN